MPNYSLGQQKPLIDAIFHGQDQQLLKAFRERMEKMERREQLAHVSGIRDEAVLDRLIELDIGPEALAALEVVPLVFVAWADGRVETEERAAIVAIAEAAGVPPQDGRYPLLEHWLVRRPAPAMLQAWKHYVKGLCQQLDGREIENLKHEVLDRARQVAEAAGGLFGFGDKISTVERRVLKELEEAFA